MRRTTALLLGGLLVVAAVWYALRTDRAGLPGAPDVPLLPVTTEIVPAAVPTASDAAMPAKSVTIPNPATPDELMTRLGATVDALIGTNRATDDFATVLVRETEMCNNCIIGIPAVGFTFSAVRDDAPDAAAAITQVLTTRGFVRNDAVITLGADALAAGTVTYVHPDGTLCQVLPPQKNVIDAVTEHAMGSIACATAMTEQYRQYIVPFMAALNRSDSVPDETLTVRFDTIAADGSAAYADMHGVGGGGAAASFWRDATGTIQVAVGSDYRPCTFYTDMPLSARTFFGSQGDICLTSMEDNAPLMPVMDL